MIAISQELSEALKAAVSPLLPSGSSPSFEVKACQDARFGDYQANIAMSLGKTLGKPPREVAQEIISKLKVDELCEKVDIAGAGFINFHLKKDLVENQLKSMSEDSNQGICKVANPKKIIIDFSSPNTAKSMHVGHIRSTFLGDALARTTRAIGHDVITDNHIGDWGTQFGFIIYGYKTFLNKQALESSPIAEYERLYKESYALSQKDPTVRDAARNELAKLQSGDPTNVQIWKEISTLSIQEFKKTYERLGVSFDHWLGESFYNPWLAEVVTELLKLNIAEKSEGAVCVFFRENEKLKDGAPLIIQKSDGAFLYGTTDLATIRYRMNEFKADELVYVTDSRQQLHFTHFFSAAQKWFSALNRPLPELRHVTFGTVLGPDKKPLKARSGDALKLSELLEEAESRSLKIIEEKAPELTTEERTHAAKTIGIGALKYADLCQNRDLDYVFDWNKLLALQGNTAPYLIYAYVRIRSIFRSVPSYGHGMPCPYTLSTPEEIALGKHLIQFSDIVHAVLHDYRPHLLTNYLYELAVRFSKFYEACPVLKADEPTRSSRLALCDLTARTLKKGLNLLGIETLEKM
jgi:arginyl-tRNA synthetase